MWVRTRDWVAPWNVPGAPGRFQLFVNDKAIDTVFGTEGSEWHWQDGGIVEIESNSIRLRLHDLTGFEGRCDAIVFSSEPDFTPPNSGEELAAFRRKALGLPEEPEHAGDFDLVVIGAGIAGICAAVSAARLGLKVALVQDRPVLGGNNSSEVRVWLGGARNCEPYPRVGDIVSELEQERKAHYGPDNIAEIYEDEKKLAIIEEEENISLFNCYRANDVETNSNRITTVVAQNVVTGQCIRCTGRWFADCTGDGCIGFWAGADYDMTLKGHMGRCNLWCSYISGKRESRRLLGDVILTKEHILSDHKFPDGCVATGWNIDLHLPHEDYQKGFEGDEFISKALFTKYPQPYWVPYRVLYSRNITNLFMAGRDISVTHEALGAVHVMRTCGLMGEIVGMAAYLCKRHDTTPRWVYQDHLEELKELMKKGVGKATKE